MKNILFLPNVAERMNQAVSEKIASHLFLFCNYQPDQVKVFSLDAKFCQGVMNLYKLVVDASIISLLPQIAKSNKIFFERIELNNCIKTVTMLRTVLGHNISAQNGTGDLQEQYELWMKQVTGKTKLQEVADYEPAVKALEQIGIAICKNLYKFIDQAAICSKRENITASWEEAIFTFYKKSSGQQIFLGQMRDAYLSRCMTDSINVQKHRLRHKVAHWFQNYYCQKEEVQIENLQKILDVYGAKLTEDVCREIQKELEEEKCKIKQIKEKIAFKIGKTSPNELNFYDYQEYYCMELDKKLRDTFYIMKESGWGNMLPESLMQELIEREFADIHSEDF